MTKLSRSIVPTKAAVIGPLLAVAIAGVALLASPAEGHVSAAMSITCAQVTGNFDHFAAGNHPIVWHVQVGSGATQAVATTETPPGFVGNGTATAGIAALTSALNGSTATVHAFATWPGGQSAVQTAQLTCGTPTQVGDVVVTAPSAAPAIAPAVAPVAAAVPVPAAVTFTG